VGFDLPFFLAVGALGWGLSLATYRPVARLMGWPMGSWQAGRLRLPVLIGILSALAAFLFAVARIYGGYANGWAIPLFGLGWAVFWTGFLRVGAQSALILAPTAAAALVIWWMR
jgi:hypothetical protein